MNLEKDNPRSDKSQKDNRLPDYHLHTALCNHAEGEVTDYRKAAGALGMPEICFADHAPNPDGYDPKHRMKLSDFCDYQAFVNTEMDQREPHVLMGLEADYYNGCEAFLEKWLLSHELDFVLGSVHYIEDWGFDNPDEMQIWKSVDIADTWYAYFQVVEKLVATGLFDAVGHLDIPKKFGHRLAEGELRQMVEPVLDKIAKAGMGMELNTSGLRKPVREIYPSPLIVTLACERDIPICFGSDAHSPAEVGKDFPAALQLAHDAGYKKYFRIKKRKKYLVPLPETF